MGGGGEGGGEESYDDQEDRYENCVGDGSTPDANRAGDRGPDAPTPDAHKGHHYISAGPTTTSPVGKGLMGGVCC